MININNDWTGTSIDERTVAFSTKVKSVNDAYVYDFTSEIENHDKKVSFQGETLDVVDYGVDHSISEDVSIFYIIAKHS